MYFIHAYQTKEAHDEDYNTRGIYKKPWLARVRETKLVTYNRSALPEPTYLTLKAIDDGTTFGFSGNSVYYSVDNGENWASLASATNTPSVKAGEKIMFKAQLSPNGTNGIGKFTSAGKFVALGCPYSLLYGDDFAGVSDLSGNVYALARLFNGCTGLTSAENLILHADTLANYCYNEMFRGCTSLTTPPELPATTLAQGCYQSMFTDCTSLKTCPKLTATVLAASCYTYMFHRCSALTKAPELNATTLAAGCYASMFRQCTSLTTAPTSLPATTLEQSCYAEMFNGCTSLTNVPSVLQATTLAPYCYSGMFGECRALTQAPKISATTLAQSSCQYMFSACTSLTIAQSVLPATTLAGGCYLSMFKGCSSLTTAPELPATTLVGNCYAWMFSGCTNLNYIKAMFTTAPSTTYTQDWVYGVASSGTFVKNSLASWTTMGVNAIPSGWDVMSESS